jgi:hypothetical protein
MCRRGESVVSMIRGFQAGAEPTGGDRRHAELAGDVGHLPGLLHHGTRKIDPHRRQQVTGNSLCGRLLQMPFAWPGKRSGRLRGHPAPLFPQLCRVVSTQQAPETRNRFLVEANLFPTIAFPST